MNFELLVEHKLKSDTVFTNKITELEKDIIDYKDILETYSKNVKQLVDENDILKIQLDELSKDDNNIQLLEQEIENQRNKKPFSFKN